MSEAMPTSFGKQTVQRSAAQFQNATTSELLKYLDLAPEFKHLVADLSGCLWNPQTNTFETDPDADKLMNNKGISNIVRVLRTYFSKSAVVNTFDEDKINAIMKDWAMFVKKLLTYPSLLKEYEINIKSRWLLRELLLKAPYMNIHRSLNGGEIDSITKMIKSSENVSQTLETEKPKSMNPFGIFKR